MGVLTGGATIATSRREFAYSEDPDVVVPPELAKCGWVPLESVTARHAADTVKLRALTAKEWTRLRDTVKREGERTAGHVTCHWAVERAGKRTKSADIAAWVDALAVQDTTALDLLARTIVSLTRGTDPASNYEEARQALGYEAPESSETPEGVADAGGPKSDG